MAITSKLIALSFHKIMQTRAYTAIVLKTMNDIKFAIYVEPSIGRIMQTYLSDMEKTRPMTHDLFCSILRGLDIRVKQVVINDVHDTMFYARLFLEQNQSTHKNIIESDARPSDAIILALMQNASIYTFPEVLDKIIPLVE